MKELKLELEIQTAWATHKWRYMKAWQIDRPPDPPLKGPVSWLLHHVYSQWRKILMSCSSAYFYSAIQKLLYQGQGEHSHSCRHDVFAIGSCQSRNSDWSCTGFRPNFRHVVLAILQTRSNVLQFATFGTNISHSGATAHIHRGHCHSRS